MTEFEFRLAYLTHLLQRDPALFLERHGGALGAGDLALFHHLRGDYEVGFHLARLAAAVAPTPEQSASARRRVKNRRLAHMRTLDAAGYFLEDAMRRREPLLYDVFVARRKGTRTTEHAGPPRADDPPTRGVGAHVGCGDGGTTRKEGFSRVGPDPAKSVCLGGGGGGKPESTRQGEGQPGGRHHRITVNDRHPTAGEEEKKDVVGVGAPTDGGAGVASGLHAVSLSLLEREDDRVAAMRLREQRRALREREAMEEEESEDEDGPGGNVGGVVRGHSFGVVPVREPSGSSPRARGEKGTGRATRDELRRAMLEGWGRVSATDDSAAQSAHAGKESGGTERKDEREETAEDAEREEEEEEEKMLQVGEETEDEEERLRAHNVRLAEFQRMMRERYLEGEDGAHVDYKQVDGNQSLDDAWRREAAQDAEDAYFDDDMDDDMASPTRVNDFDDSL